MPLKFGHAFSSSRVIHDIPCTKNALTEWWMLHGYEMPKLKEFSVRVLSQLSGASQFLSFEVPLLFENTCTSF